MKLISVNKDVASWAPRGQLIAILYKTTAISIGPGLVPKPFNNGLGFEWKSLARPSEGEEYTYSGYSYSLMPGLNSAVCQWPAWYRWLWKKLSWRNYDVCGVLKSVDPTDV